MKDEQQKSILYRPHLEVPKNYNTDGVLSKQVISTEEYDLSNQKQDLIHQIELLKSSLLFIPGAIRPATESILNLVLFLLILNQDKNKDDDGDQEYEIITPDVPPPIVPNPDQDSSDNNTILDQIFKDHKPKTIMKQTVSESAKIDRYYSNSTLDISSYYVDRLSEILADYHANLLIQPELEKVLEDTYNTPLIDYSNQVAHSILQALLKSQQDKISKMRLYQKLYNEKESLTLLKSLEYSKLTLLKLSNSDSVPKNHRLYYKHLQILEGERHKLDKKLFEYYRYLDSSLDALSMCLNMQITEAVAKIELNNIQKEFDKK